METKQSWLHGAVVYQIYPRSFKDAGSSGIGNLQGIISKLDYLKGTPDSLDVTAIWLSPIYTSPMADFGYDVSNYTDIDPIFGNLYDFKQLIEAAHERSLKVIMDFVPNHSSDQHPWFIEAKSSLDNPKRDWYVWRDAGPDDRPPNNWLGVFGGSAWQLSPETGQYYLHSFLAQQPDLNWDNPAVREAMKANMRFWLDLGVDGFRVDAVDWLSKDAEMRDDPANPDPGTEVAGHDHGSLLHTYSRDGPHLFERLDEMTEVLKEYDERFMITEGHPETQDKIQGYLKYYQGVNPHLSAPFNFEGIYLPWQAAAFRNFVDAFQGTMQPEYTPIYTVGNHDESRIASRIGPAAAHTAAVMLLTLPGIAFMYYGDELGMHDVAIAPDQAQDPFAKPGFSRDPQRTPMQWDDSPQAGFSAAAPWLPVATDYAQVNVATESANEASLLNLYKKLISYRKNSAILTSGSYIALDVNEQVFCYARQLNGNKLIIALNFSDAEQSLILSGVQGRVRLSTNYASTDAEVNGQLSLGPNEGLVLEVTND